MMEAICQCGHEVGWHATNGTKHAGGCTYGHGTAMGGCRCEKFRRRGRSGTTRRVISPPLEPRRADRLAKVRAAFDALRDAVCEALSEERQMPAATTPLVPRPAPLPSPKAAPMRPTRDEDVGGLVQGEAKLLIAVATLDRGQGVERVAIGLFVDYKSTSVKTYAGALARGGLIEKRGGRLFLTDAGRRALPKGFRPAPKKPRELVAFWQEHLPEGERRIFEAVLSGCVSRDAIAERTSYRATSVKTYLGALRRRGIVVASDGGVELAPMLRAS